MELDLITLTVNRRSDLASELWAQLGYEGCRDLREALRHCMADHRAAIAEERRAAGLTRPRATRNPTLSAQCSAIAGSSETSANRVKAVERWAPHLIPDLIAGQISAWAAYQEAVKARDSAALRALAITHP